jgi:hypothetical protein
MAQETATTNANSGMTLTITKVNQYIKSGYLTYLYTVSGDKEAVEQYEADQEVTAKKGCQYHEVTKEPLYWSTDAGETIVRSGKTRKWNVDNTIERAVSQKINSLNRVGNEKVADKLADRLADSIMADIEAVLRKRSNTTAGAKSETPEEQEAKTTEDKGLDGV